MIIFLEKEGWVYRKITRMSRHSGRDELSCCCQL